MNRLNTWIFRLLLMVAMASYVQADELEVVKLSGREYVRLVDFCEFYGFPKPKATKPQFLKGPYGTLELFKDDRKIEINGYRAWLSLPIRSASKGLYISKIDADLLLAPVLRPEEVVPRKKVKGVVIDAGHGGADRGARSSNGYTEKQAALFTALELKKMFEKDGIDVVMTRSRDVFVQLHERARIANKHPDHIFISIHYNSVYVKSANGIETFSMTPRGVGSTSAGGRIRRSDYTSYNGNKHDVQNTLLMNYMHEELMTHHTEKGDRGLKRARFLVLREVKIPAVLVEGGFMSHYIDARLIRSESYKKKVAAAIYRATKRYIEVMNSPLEAARSGLNKKPEPIKQAELEPENAAEPERKVEQSEATATEPNGESPELKTGAEDIPLREPDESELKARELEIVERLKRAIEAELESDESLKEPDDTENKESTDGG
ncbi:MAG: N-acetylmuramoyl-L-alanine amidase [Verrucomicrobiota bacterium]